MPLLHRYVDDSDQDLFLSSFFDLFLLLVSSEAFEGASEDTSKRGREDISLLNISLHTNNGRTHVHITNKQDTNPHLAQAWTAQSSGDGLPGQIGKESYLFCDEKHLDEDCIRAHIWDYGASCTKYEINGGFKFPYTGTFYVNCDAVDCCASSDEDYPDVKMWDIGQGGSWIMSDKVTYEGKSDCTELNNVQVKDADKYVETMKLPFTKVGINYTYFITQSGNDTISHRIDYFGGSNQSSGAILYGDFQVQHDLDTFRKVFQPPAACLKPNTLTCDDDKVKEWNMKHFKHTAAERGYFAEE